MSILNITSIESAVEKKLKKHLLFLMLLAKQLLID